MKNFKCLIAFFILFVASGTVLAQSSTVDTGILNTIVENFQKETSVWGSAFISAAKFIFFSLALVSFIWHIGQLALKGFEITELFAELIRFVVITGLFYVLLINAPAIANSIFKGLANLAGSASGLNTKISPSGIITMGFGRMGLVFEQMPTGVDNLHLSIPMAICAVCIVILCTVIAINYTLLLCSSYILSYAGIILLGFGGARFTSDIALNYLKTVISIGIQLMTMILIIGLGVQFMIRVVGHTVAFDEIAPVVLLLVSVFIVMYLSLKLPPIVAGIITGSSIGATAGLGAGWGSVMAAAGAAGAAGAAMYNKSKEAGGALASAAGSAVSSMAFNAAGTGAAFREAIKMNGGGGNGSSSSGNGNNGSGSEKIGDSSVFAKEHLASGASPAHFCSSPSRSDNNASSFGSRANSASSHDSSSSSASGGGASSASASNTTGSDIASASQASGAGSQQSSPDTSAASNFSGNQSASSGETPSPSTPAQSQGSSFTASNETAAPSQGSVTGTIAPVESTGSISGSQNTMSTADFTGYTGESTQRSMLGRIASATGTVAKATASQAGQGLWNLSREKMAIPVAQRFGIMKQAVAKKRDDTFMFKVADSIKNRVR